ncbi:MAG: hypothetical protein ACXACB_06245 [Promethearchaeota archaeon]
MVPAEPEPWTCTMPSRELKYVQSKTSLGVEEAQATWVMPPLVQTENYYPIPLKMTG